MQGNIYLSVNEKRAGMLPVLAFASLGLIWGSNFIYMKMAADLISPGQVVFFRVLFGFLPVGMYALFTGAFRLAHLRFALHYFVMSVLACSLYYYAFVRGTSLLLSGIAGALSGAIPLFSFLLAACLVPEEMVTPRKVLGVAVGFLGVLLIGSPSGEDLLAANIEGIVCMAVGSLSVGASFVYARKYVVPLKIPAAALATYQLGFGLLTLAAVTDFSGMERIWTDLHASVGLVVGLGLLGTGCAYIIYYFLVEWLGAMTASSVTYIPPVVALVIGAIIVGEPLAAKDYVASMLILLGVVLLKKG